MNIDMSLYESNSVILAGNEAQLHRFMVVAQALDRADVDEVRILRLAERSVAEVVPILAELTRDSQHSTGASGVSIWADERSNALIVRASPARFEDIRHWVEALDTEREGWGEVQVILANLGDAAFEVTHGMRIAQMVVAPVTRLTWQETEQLPETARGDGGFGSTGTG